MICCSSAKLLLKFSLLISSLIFLAEIPIPYIAKLTVVSSNSAASIAKLGKGGNITTDVLLKICETLNCHIEDILETVDD